MERTLHIRTPANNGTAFAINVGDQQYLITAKHMVGGILPGETVRVQTKLSVEAMSFAEVALGVGDPGEGGVDVAVLRPMKPLSFRSDPPALGRQEDMFVTQNVSMPTAEHFGQFESLGAPVVVVRTGTVAAIVESRSTHTGDLLVGIGAYPGFSGSPVVYWDRKGRPRIGAVAARWSHRSLVPELGSDRIHSGFIGCFHIGHALDLIRGMG